MYAALASYLQAKAQGGKWLLRIDDLDTFRISAAASDEILRTLEIYGLYWDDRVYFQSQHIPDYCQAVQQLTRDQQTYACICTRKKLALLRSSTKTAPIYPGYCRNKAIKQEIPHAIRVKVTPSAITFNDKLQGNITEQLDTEHGDFIIQRKDQIYAYQLAVCVDDNVQKVTEVVRGYDLLDSTVKQIHLQQLLQFATPSYMHVPVLTDTSGCKLSKQSFAAPVTQENPSPILFHLLTLLQQQPPKSLRCAPVSEQLEWAITHWQPEALINQHAFNIIPNSG